MNRKIRSGILALFAAIFALAVVIAPTRADAKEIGVLFDGSSYGLDVKVTVDSTTITTPAQPKSITATVIVDGTSYGESTVGSIPRAGSSLTVDADGYDVTFVTPSGISLDDTTGYHSIAFGEDDSYHITINLAKQKDSDDISITDGTTNYGTFSWAKVNAGNVAFTRELTVRVNGEIKWTQTVNTPKSLTNGAANNQYWFTPNQELYVLNRVEITPGDSLVETDPYRDITVSLYTRCACGNATCLCEGGCDCPEGCDCKNCKPVLASNQIDTGFGILEYKEPSGSGYNLTVRVYVNGQRSFESNQLRVRTGEIDSLNFTPASGYYYHELNGYDLYTKNSGSSWDQRTGYLLITGSLDVDRDYDNVLDIYLWTFSNHTALDVERRVGDVNDNVEGYYISYDAYDPETGGTKTYTYLATSFEASQTQTIPTGTPVTLTAKCKPGWEVTQWSSSEVYQGGITLVGSEGNESEATAKGNSATLTVDATWSSRVIVYIDQIGRAADPTNEEVIDLVGENGVLVDCINPYANHADQTFALTDGSFTITRTDDATATVSVTPDSYIDAYETAMYGEEHWAHPEDQNLTFTLEHDGTGWKIAAGQTPVKLMVNCDAEPAPEPPTTDDIEELLANNAVSVTDKNDEVDHGDNEAAIFGPIDYSYRIGDVTPTTDGGYTCDVTFESIYYVNAYEELVGSDHELAEGEQSEKDIRFVWDAENNEWAVDKNANPVNFDVVCQTPDPGQPDLPDIDDLPGIFGTDSAVLVDCVNTEIDPAHADATYDIKAATYGWENFGADDNGQYTVDLRVSPYAYVDAYSAANGAHSLTVDSADSKVITLVYDVDGQTWKIAADQPQQFVFQVVCETPQPGEPAVPEPPTDDELQQIFADGLVSVDCTTSGVDHDLKTFKPIAEGGYAFGEINGNVEDGAAVEMTVFPQAYVGAYEAAYGNIPHALTDGQKAATVTLTYANGSWSVAEDFAPIAYTVFCTTCPSVPGGDTTPDAPSIDEVNDLFADGAVKVTCVNEDVDHGSETYELKNGAATVGAPTKDGGSWKVVVTVTPGQYVLDFQTAKGVHHTLQPSDQGEKTFTLVYTSGKWVLEDSDALIEYTVICADDVTGPDDPGTDPGTDPDEPGTDPDDPGTNPDDPGTNPDDPGTDPDDPGTDPDKPGTDPDKPGTDPGTNPDDPGNDQGNGGNNIGGKKPSGSKIPNAGDATNVGLVTTVALAGVTASGAALVAYKRRR